MRLEFLPLEVFWACPTGRKHQGRPRTRNRDYISYLAWKEIPPHELESITRERNVWTTLLNLMPQWWISAHWAVNKSLDPEVTLIDSCSWHWWWLWPLSWCGDITKAVFSYELWRIKSVHCPELPFHTRRHNRRLPVSDMLSLTGNIQFYLGNWWCLESTQEAQHDKKVCCGNLSVFFTAHQSSASLDSCLLYSHMGSVRST